MSDFLGHVGTSHYPWPQIFVDEVRKTGFSKKVPHTFAQVIEPGTRFGLTHERAIVEVTAPEMTLNDLAMELLFELSEVTPEALEDVDMVKAGMIQENGMNTLRLINCLQEAESRGMLDRIVKKYGIKFREGVFAYVFLTGKQIVLPPDVDEIPEKYLGLGLEPVHDFYVED